MMTRRMRGAYGFLLGLAILGTPVGVVRADPTYTITDLGTGPITLTTASGSTVPISSPIWNPSPFNDQFASVSNGQNTYSFLTTPDTVLGPGNVSILPSVITGNPNSPDMYYQGLMNSNGVAVFSNLTEGVANPNVIDGGGYQYLSWSTAYAAQQNPDGSWAQPTTIVNGPTQVFDWTNSIEIVGLNAHNQALLYNNYQAGSYPYSYPNAYLYSQANNSLINLNQTVGNSFYYDPVPIAIDNQGQILLQAQEYGPSSILTTTLLLKPDGGPSSPQPI